MASKELTAKKENRVDTERRRAQNWMTPAVDIYETEEALTLVADLPGVARDALELGVDHEILTIEGRIEADAASVAYREFAGGYYRRFQLPDNLDLDKIGADMRHGVLTVTLPKAAAARPRRIEVSVH